MLGQESTGVGAPVTYSEHQSGLPVPIDMTDIFKYEAMIEDITKINSINGPLYMQEFLKAKELASSFFCKLLLDYERAKNRRKEAEAVAYLEKSEEYLKTKGLKSTDGAKQHYVQIDPEFQKAKNEEDCLKALVTLFESKVFKFQAAHDDAKKIYDQSKDPRGSLPSIPSGRDAQ